MKQSRRERRAQARLERKNKPAHLVTQAVRHPVRWRNRVILAILALSLCAVAGSIFVKQQRQQPEPEKIAVVASTTLKAQLPQAVTPQLPAPAKTRVIKDAPLPPRGHLTIETLLERTPEGLNGIDIAEMNLLCATGLPGAEQINIPESLATLDKWAEIVERCIKQNRHRFIDNPAEYKNSESFFKMVMLVLTLQQDLNVHYDSSKIGKAILSNDPEVIKRDLEDGSYFRDSKSIFLHGILGDERQGTCSSMPVLYVAVGRRLGFPLKLVTAVGHFFVRWDGNGERFNIEGTNTGVNSHPDEFYMKWPLPMSKEDIDKGIYLKSLTPAEELASFMGIRFACLEENQRYSEAMVAIAQANRFWPHIFNTEVGLANIAEIVTSPVNRHEPSPRQIQKEAELAAEALNYQNRENERVKLMQEIQQLRGNPNQRAGFPTPPFNAGLPPRIPPFSPAGFQPTPIFPTNQRQNVR